MSRELWREFSPREQYIMMKRIADRSQLKSEPHQVTGRSKGVPALVDRSDRIFGAPVNGSRPQDRYLGNVLDKDSRTFNPMTAAVCPVSTTDGGRNYEL